MSLQELSALFTAYRTHTDRGRQTHQTVLLPVVQPVTRPSCADDSLKLVGFHPNDFIDTLVTG